jgi:sigma-B regulation protein RsbU (phosphoserine phosphatase)
MLNKSIAYRLSIYISLAVIGVFIAFIIFSYYFNSTILRSNIENKAIAKGSQAMMLGERQLVSTKEITFNVSEQVLFFAQHNDVDFLVSKLMTKYHYLNAIHVNIDSVVPNLQYHNYYYVRANDSIDYESGNELIYQCKMEKKILDGIIAKDTPGWTEVFNCKRNNKEVVSFYSPIRIQNSNHELVTIGSVITELSLSELNDSINSLKIGNTDYAFLVSKDGTYLTHPNKDYILNRNLYSLPPKIHSLDSIGINALLNKGMSGSIIAYPDYLNYEKCWTFYTPIKETGWTLIFVVPYDELFVPLYLLVLRMLFFSVLGILIIFFIVTYISNKLILPLSTVTSQLKKFSSTTGEFEINTRNEVELVSGSLDYLKTWYEKFKINQHQEEKLNTQREQDLLEASEIQMSLINNDFSAFEERTDIDLYAIYKPARIVSGDLFDFIFLDKDNLFFTIGDVSGKGISAAFFMSVAQTLLKSNSRFKTPGKIVSYANNELFTANQHQFFLTLFCGVLNIKTGVLKYCNAAHTPILILNMNGEITELEQSHGIPLGLHPNREYAESSLKLKAGDSLVLYSDGVTEIQNEYSEHFGNERFYRILHHLSTLKPKILIEEIEKNLDLFKGKMKQADDITIMVLQFKDKKKV